MRTGTERDAEGEGPAPWSRARAVAGSTVVTIIVVIAAVACVLAAAPAKAQSSWNFQSSNGGWTSTWDGPWTPNGYKWLWTGTTTPNPLTGGTSPHWHVLAQQVTESTPTAYLLTSPVFSGLSGTVPSQNARISIAHDFLLRMGTGGSPITAGQLQYRLNGSGTWIGLPLAAFTSGSSVLIDDPVFGPSPFKSGTSTQFVNQTSYVAPTYVTPTGTAALPYISPGAAAFTGTTPGWSTGYVPSQAFLNANTGLPASGITSLELRFTNLNLASNCGVDDGWNVRFVQVDFDTGIPPVPEPGTLALGAVGLASLIATRALRRRRRHQRASSPSDSPWTTTLPAVSVDPRMGFVGQSMLEPNCAGASASPPSQKAV